MTYQAQYTTTTPAFRLTATPASGVALPLTDPSNLGNRPLAAFLQADTHDIRFTVDGTAPTASVGTLLVAGAAPFLYAGDLSALRFIQTESGSKLNVVYASITATVGPQGPPGIQGAPGSQGPQGPATSLTALAALGVYPGSELVGPVAIAFDTPNLATGVQVTAMNPGDALLGWWVLVDTAFNTGGLFLYANNVSGEAYFNGSSITITSQTTGTNVILSRSMFPAGTTTRLSVAKTSHNMVVVNENGPNAGALRLWVLIARALPT